MYVNQINIGCAYNFTGKDACGGDSGGPLTISRYRNLDEYWTQIGIVSWGLISCGTEGVPGVYTNVRRYLSWILDNID